jgi:hypothetical protein
MEYPMHARKQRNKALFHLIDDPDQEVFDSVSNRIVSYGRGIIPTWKTSGRIPSAMRYRNVSNC